MLTVQGGIRFTFANFLFALYKPPPFPSAVIHASFSSHSLGGNSVSNPHPVKKAILTLQHISIIRSRGDSAYSSALRVPRLQPALSCCRARPVRSSSHSFGAASCSNPHICIKANLKIQTILLLRSRGDSNPRYLSAQRFSRPPP